MSTTTAYQGTVEHIDPNAIIIEANVRPSAPLTKEFVASIRENGVLTPVLARRDAQGNVVVRAGQRRTLAAREAGLSSIPAYIVEADEATVERIVQQMVENDQREALTDGERAAAFQQLAFEGLSVTAIAKRTGTKQAVVKSGLAVAENAVAASAIQEHQLTLDQAATLIEFEDDEATRADLIGIAINDPAQFAHAAQRARDDRARAQVKAQTEDELRGRGYEILDHDRGYYETDYRRRRTSRTPGQSGRKQPMTLSPATPHNQPHMGGRDHTRSSTNTKARSTPSKWGRASTFHFSAVSCQSIRLPEETAPRTTIPMIRLTGRIYLANPVGGAPRTAKRTGRTCTTWRATSLALSVRI